MGLVALGFLCLGHHLLPLRLSPLPTHLLEEDNSCDDGGHEESEHVDGDVERDGCDHSVARIHKLAFARSLAVHVEVHHAADQTQHSEFANDVESELELRREGPGDDYVEEGLSEGGSLPRRRGPARAQQRRGRGNGRRRVFLRRGGAQLGRPGSREYAEWSESLPGEVTQ